MNLSRAYSLAYSEELSVGRVQTPTLAMVVERELAIRSFVPEDYLEVVATFPPNERHKGEHVSGHVVPRAAGGRERTRNRCRRPCGCPSTEKRRTASSSERALVRPPSSRSNPKRNVWLRRALRSHGTTAARQSPVRFQRPEDAGSRPGAVRTPQAHQLSAHGQPALSQDVAATLPRIVKTIEAPYREHLAAGHGRAPTRAAVRR